MSLSMNCAFRVLCAQTDTPKISVTVAANSSVVWRDVVDVKSVATNDSIIKVFICVDQQVWKSHEKLVGVETPIVS